MDYGTALLQVRRAASRGITELAGRSGISRPTLYRFFSGAAPRIDDLHELAIASGWELELDLRPLSDPLAGIAARLELGDESVGAWADEAAHWRERLRRFVGARGRLSSETGLIDEAGRATAPADRSGAIFLRGDHRDVDRLVSAGRASTSRWALSGWAALDALGIETGASTIMWTDDARTTVQLLHGSFSPGRRGSVGLIVAPAHPSVFADAGAVEDVELVAPLQAYIDAAGLGGDARDRVLSELRSVE